MVKADVEKTDAPDLPGLLRSGGQWRSEKEEGKDEGAEMRDPPPMCDPG